MKQKQYIEHEAVQFGIVMVWIGNLYLSVIIVLFGIYIIVLQMSQIYTAQAYLLWPKVWPVDRRFIQKSYVTYSPALFYIKQDLEQNRI